jgi:eukaryotic-like serine/threonine-protein kinase
MAHRLDRIRSLAARSRFRVGAVLVHPDRLLIERDGEEIALEPRVMELLTALAEHAGQVLSSEQLLIEVWRGSFYGDNPVHRAVAALRRHLADDPRQPRYIETIRKRGYRLLAPVAFPGDYCRTSGQSGGWAGRNPYLGLVAFDRDHAEVFFGRARLTADVLNALRSQRDAQRRFVLLVGASGCGKTSLLHAAVLPLLQQEHGFDGLHALSMAHCDFAARDQAPALQLASALSQWAVDGREVLPPLPAGPLAEQIAQRPELIGQCLDEAWGRRRPRPNDSHHHLLLVVDHAEVLASAVRCSEPQRQQIWAAIEAICAHPRGSVLMVVRGDFHASLIDALPGIEELKRGHGHLDACPPRAGEIAQIVRGPAGLAGLQFEEDPTSAARLDDVLRDAAACQPDALPLLQHTLHALYEQRTEEGTLTFAAYHALGGLEGALAHRAEKVFLALPGPVRDQLGTVLSLLVLLQSDSDSVSARRVLRESLPDPAAQALIEAFIGARLFVGGHNDGRADFGVSHEALLRHWPRIREWTEENRRLLRAHAHLQRDAARWEEAGRLDDHLLNGGQPLSEALEAARHQPRLLSGPERALLDASLRQREGRRRRRRIAATSLLMLSALSGGLALWAHSAQREAEQRRENAQRLLHYMLVDLADRLRPLGRLDLLDSIGSEALQHLAEIPPSNDPTGALIRARGLRTLGEVEVTRQQFDRAVPMLEQAASLIAASLGAPGEHAEALHYEAGQIAFWRGQLAYWRRDMDSARAHWELYLQQAQAYAELASDPARGQQEIAYANNNLGTVEFADHRLSEALERFSRAVEIRRRLVIRPEDETSALALIDTLAWIAQVETERGNASAAVETYSEGLEWLAGLPAGIDEASRRRREISLRFSLAQLLTELGERTAAEQQLDRALTGAQLDVANDPSQPRRQAVLAHIAFRMARTEHRPREIRELALRVGEKALARLEASALPTTEKLHAQIESCSAKLALAQAGAACALALRPQLSNVDGLDSARLAPAVAELASRAGADQPDLVKLARELLARVPEARRGSLRYQLSVASLQARERSEDSTAAQPLRGP